MLKSLMRGIHHSTEKAIEPAAMVTLRTYVVALLSGLSMTTALVNIGCMSGTNGSNKTIESLELPHALDHET